MLPRSPIPLPFLRLLPIALIALMPVMLGACGPAPAEEPSTVVEDTSGQAPEAPAEPTMTDTNVEPAEPAAPAAPVEPAEPAATGPTTYVIETSESSAGYAVDEEFFEGAVERFGEALGPTITVGRTPDVSGSLTVEGTDPPAIVGGEIRVGLAGLSSDQGGRDRQVRGRILKTASFPDAVFVPTSIENFPPNPTEGQLLEFQMVGDMTIAGMTVPLTFDVSATVSDGRIDGQATASFNMSDFGVEPPSFLGVYSVADLVTVDAVLVLIAEPQAATGAGSDAVAAFDVSNQGGPGTGSEGGSAESVVAAAVVGAASSPGVVEASSDAPAPFLGMPAEPHPLQISWLRAHPKPGSDFVIHQTLDPGSNYDRFLASYESDGLTIYALLTIPHGEKPASGWPAIVFNHGYIPPAQYRTTERYVAYTDAFSRNGYVVLKSDYRGHGSSEGAPSGGYGSQDYTVDVLNGMASLKRHPDVDANRIGMWGHSMGGHITLRAMVADPSIKAGVIWAGVVASYSERMDRWRQRDAERMAAAQNTTTDHGRSWRSDLVASFGEPEQNPEFWASLSPNSFLSELSGPIQLHHGTADHSVPVEYSQTLHADLQAITWPSELFVYPGDDHNISAALSTALQRSVDFFNAHVKGG